MFRLSLVMVVTVIVCSIATRSASSQSLTVKTDNVRINGGKADFGSGSHNGGGAGDGTVTWSVSTSNGSLSVGARVRGVLYWDATEKGCAVVNIEFLNGSRDLAGRQKTVCGPGGNANDPHNQVPVDEAFASVELRSIAISTQVCDPANVLCSEAGSSFGGVSFQSGSNRVRVDAPSELRKYDVTINNGSTDFGRGLHAFGSPTGSANVTLKYDSAGKVTGLVSGTLYWDDLLLPGCAQLIIDFEAATGAVLDTRNLSFCGSGGNANELKNNMGVHETFINGSLMQIRLRVGTLHGNGSFTNVKTKLCNFKECN